MLTSDFTSKLIVKVKGHHSATKGDNARGKIGRVNRTRELANALPSSYQNQTRVELERLEDANIFAKAVQVELCLYIPV